jgi:hypothetical protein
MSMQVFVRVNQAAVVKAGKTSGQTARVTITDEVVSGWNDEQRSVFAGSLDTINSGENQSWNAKSGENCLRAYSSRGSEIYQSNWLLTVDETTPSGVIDAVLRSKRKAQAEAEEFSVQDRERKEKQQAEWTKKDAELSAAPIDMLVTKHYGGKWEAITETRTDYYPLTCARREEAEAEAKRRNDDELAEVERKRLEEAKRKEKEKAELRSWAEMHGSELTKLRLAEGFDTWESSARGDRENIAEEYANEIVNSIGDDAGVPDEMTFDDYEERKSPTVEEIKALRLIRESLGNKGTASLVWAKYTPDDDDGKGLSRAEIKVNISHEFGNRERFLLIPEAK